MRISYDPEDFEENFKVAQLESVRGFGDNTMYIEKYIQDPRHVEFPLVQTFPCHTAWVGLAPECQATSK